MFTWAHAHGMQIQSACKRIWISEWLLFLLKYILTSFCQWHFGMAVCHPLHEPVSPINLLRNVVIKEPYHSVIINNLIEEMTNSQLEFPVSLERTRMSSFNSYGQSMCLYLPLSSKGCNNQVTAKLVRHMELCLVPQQYGHESLASLHQWHRFAIVGIVASPEFHIGEG